MIYNQIVTWTAFAILAMFYSVLDENYIVVLVRSFVSPFLLTVPFYRGEKPLALYVFSEDRQVSCTDLSNCSALP